MFQILVVALICSGIHGSKICYRCDNKNPSSSWKLIGEKITKCDGVPFENYATKTSKALGAQVLTCFTEFDASGKIVKRGAYDLGEVINKNFKCNDRFHICCEKAFCNTDMVAPCPPAERVTEKKEVKACYQCKGAANCETEKLSGSDVRVSAALGGSTLYCYSKFDDKTGKVVERGGFGYAAVVDKNLKCDSKFYLCCYENLCNKQSTGYCGGGGGGATTLSTLSSKPKPKLKKKLKSKMKTTTTS
ncbi:unnamed protein product [Didymodactylos carnosus]|uniref:Sodefrin-like factor n=1 Tax=Didymodactylos carnosus TaxID=1234261 RepID=A0A814FDM6_9BILA|nr:unnamed protein product [Didymodactylos carnosus]CAF0980296.1 unnamed protein product [Didymodactylos carnosus]CAF3575956.1 unnamed protein product [Didymodactylos carnosus]CAF3752860.1 unnamed protein product [Didymodactylos carnosus]